MSITIVNKITAVLLVDRIEPVLPFWEKLGYRKTVEVPTDQGLGFAILTSGNTEVMYQTRSSLAADMPGVAEAVLATSLFVEVSDLAAVESALADEPVFLARRETFYGSTEIGFREPGGHFVTFAQFNR